jgi:hypothetical protein
VASLTTRCSAISALDRPDAISVSTSASRGVRPSGSGSGAAATPPLSPRPGAAAPRGPGRPTTGLDPEARRRLWAVIENLTAGGTTILLTTHYLDEAQRLARRVIVLADGRVTADATPDELRALPAGLAGHVTDGVLMLPSADVTADLALLTGWARDNSVDLTGLEVGPPSLEDAYLALTSEKGALNHG